MGAKAGGEQPIAIGDMGGVAGPPTGGADRAGHDVGPGVDTPGGIANDRGLTCGPGRGVDAHHFLFWHREQAEGIVVAQVGRLGEQELGEIGKVGQVIRVRARRVEGLLMEGHTVIGVAQRPFHPL